MIKKSRKNVGVYAGSFDPVTYGHLEIAYHAGEVMSKVFMIVGVNAAKKPMFTTDERVQMIRDDLDTIVVPKLKKAGLSCEFEVAAHSGLTTEFMKANNAPFHIRGLRQGFEFDQEAPVIQASLLEHAGFRPIFLCTLDNSLQHVSSSITREIARHNGQSLGHYVTPATAAKLRQRIVELTPKT